MRFGGDARRVSERMYWYWEAGERRAGARTSADHVREHRRASFGAPAKSAAEDELRGCCTGKESSCCSTGQRCAMLY